jgi:hypothetical protein
MDFGDQDALEKAAIKRLKERETVLAIAQGFEEMPIFQRLGYVKNILNRHLFPEEGALGPIELQVAESVLDQVLEILQQCPSAGTLVEHTASEFELTKPPRIPPSSRSDKPSDCSPQ